MGPAPVPFFGTLRGFGSPHARFWDFVKVQNASKIDLLLLDEHHVGLKINHERQNRRRKEIE